MKLIEWGHHPLKCQQLQWMQRVYHLDRSEMNEIVSSFFGNSEAILPLAKRTKALGQHCLTVNAIDGQDFIFKTVGQNRIDQEVARSARRSILTVNLHLINPVWIHSSKLLMRMNAGNLNELTRKQLIGTRAVPQSMWHYTFLRRCSNNDKIRKRP